ncbi:MAG: polysaccharide pyruvyl transferase family protein [Wujia sp.]
MKRFLITGADFRNKGGQSMLYITVDELRKRFPGCMIYYPTNKPVDPNYKVTPVYYNFDSLYYMHGGGKKLEAMAKGCAKKALKKGGNLKQIVQLEKVFPKLDAIVDVSGFNLSSDWTEKINFKFLEFIRQAKKYEIPMYLMPQSFGPFDYKNNQAVMDKDIKELLSYCKVVYAREEDGLKQLQERYGLENVELAPDLVLQNAGIDLANLFVEPPVVKPVVEIEKNSVAVIPNLRSFEHGSKCELLNLYKALITLLRKKGKTVYVFRHAGEDLVACQWIKEMFDEDRQVILIEEDLDCLSYSALIENFEFAIASRYHAIVHALKKHVPCVALGWAIKYLELLQKFDMQDFVFDVRKDMDMARIEAAVTKLCEEHESYAETIAKEMEKISSQDCYDILGGKKEQERKDVEETTVAHQLCCSCGVCAGVCPTSCITMGISESGQCLPEVDQSRCTNCGICSKVCPGNCIDFEDMAKKTKNPWNNDLLVGDIQACYTGYAKDEKIRAKSVSGGCVTTLVRELLDTKQYESAFVVDTYSYENPVTANRLTSEDDWSKTPLSRYVTISHEKTVAYMREHPDEKIIIVAVGCAITGILNAIAQYRLHRENYLFVGLVCDKTMTNRVQDYFANLAKGQMEELYFRTKEQSGWPGNVGIKVDGAMHYYPAKTRIRVKEYFQPERCLYCLDKLNRYADVVFGDNYLGTSDEKGSNVIFVYTELGKTVLQTDKLVLSPVEKDSAIAAMKLHVRKKNLGYLRLFERSTGVTLCKQVKPDKTNAFKTEYENRLAKIQAGRIYKDNPAAFEKLVNQKPSLPRRVYRKLFRR